MGSLFEQLNAGICIGLVLQIIGRIVGRLLAPSYTDGIGGAVLLGAALSLVGLVIMIWGCMQMCVEKGYSKWLALLGIFSCLGLLVLLVIPPKS